MGDTEAEERQHSTAQERLRLRLRWRFFGALVLIGFLVGLMLGRVLQPDPVRLLQLDAEGAGLTLWFDREPGVQADASQGVFALHLQAQGRADEGQLRLSEGALVNWRLRPGDDALTLLFVATRPLRGTWHAEADGERWRLQVSVALQDEPPD